MDSQPSFATILTGGRRNMERRRLQERDRRAARLYMLAALLVLLTGLTAVSVPPLRQYAWDTQATENAQTAAAAQNTDETQWEAAQAYNRRLAANPQAIGDPLTGDASWSADTEYQSLLDGAGTGIMGVLEIPRISLTLPIGHGTAPATLDSMLGHVHNTSLPVGGMGTRTVISGHTGVQGRTLFTRLDELRVGDRFTITTLGHTLTYQVTGTQTVSPQDTGLLAPEPGRDLATLLTCTGPGLSQRLLVTGERIPDTQMVTGMQEETDPKPLRTGLTVTAATMGIGLAAAWSERRKNESTSRKHSRE